MAENNAIALATIMNDQPGTSMCTITPDPGNMEQAKVIYNAMNNPTHKLSDFVNKEIVVENFLVEVTEMANEETGELTNAPKCVLISPDGVSILPPPRVFSIPCATPAWPSAWLPGPVASPSFPSM